MKKAAACTLILCILFMSLSPMKANALASVFEHSDSYRASEYYDDLLSVQLTGNYANDIAAVALSQVGYHEGKSSGDLGGSSSGKENFTEYGFNYGLPSDAWCAAFVWWCARQSGVNESIIRKTEWAKTTLYSFESTPLSAVRSISVGDIAFVDMSYGDGIEDHVGIVVEVSDDKITTVEGNSSNAVRKQTYSRSTGLRSDGAGTLLYIGKPDYKGENTFSSFYETVFVSSEGASTYSSINGEKTGVLGDGEYMLLAADPTGQWLQIVAPNGLDSHFISAEKATLTVKNLPPITGYDAWSSFDPAVSEPTSAPSIAVPEQTDPSVTTTATTTSATVPTTVPSEPTQPIDIDQDTDNGYVSSFGNDWIEPAAYVLLGILAIAFIVILASLLRSNGSDR